MPPYQCLLFSTQGILWNKILGIHLYLLKNKVQNFALWSHCCDFLSFRRSAAFVNLLPLISDAALLPISTAWSQFTDSTATIPVDTNTSRSASYPANGRWVCNHPSKIARRSLMSLACELCRRSLCCSDVPVWPPDCSNASQIEAQQGRA